jgi:hypothetical protein
VKPVDSITEAIIGDAIAVHREPGPGLLESTYEACLAEVGLLINFNVARLADGVRRVVRGYQERASGPSASSPCSGD